MNEIIEETKAIFRKFKDDGSIIAMFPEELGTNSPYTCECYMHIGQHSTCDPVYVIQMTKLAKSEEYQYLKKELESISYKLKIIKRY